MIVGERKPISEIVKNVASAQRLLIVGCNSCVAVCLAGGEKEVAVMASMLRLALRETRPQMVITERCVERQCEEEFNRDVADDIATHDIVLSMACGVGVQTLAEQFPSVVVYPGLNTSFMGRPEAQGIWAERCAGCGDCVLDKFGGVCPIARCSKSLLNGPCGGSAEGRCEVDPENLDCAWQLIYDRLSRIGQLDRLLDIEPPKDWSTGRDGGPRRIIRKDMRV
ncbi:MAG: methylenetetrahydrofolate reductase C-terminal domain-containing protein [Anaerolineae bacterium]|nr:methylenetetrahydrofolate reductase C-terminal domain-containing protein [Anaerolineae bacterium]